MSTFFYEHRPSGAGERAHDSHGTHRAPQRVQNVDVGHVSAGRSVSGSTHHGGGPKRHPQWPVSMAGLQAKLKINRIGDAHEQEADRVADTVVRGGVVREPLTRVGGSMAQRMCEPDEFDDLQRKAKGSAWQSADNGVTATTARSRGDRSSELIQRAVAGGGEPLPEKVRSTMESRIGYDFGDVRVHTKGRAPESAEAINARAYTTGRHIVFNTGEYNPGTKQGAGLLAHELAHVVQQGQGRSMSTVQRARKTEAAGAHAGAMASKVQATGTADLHGHGDTKSSDIDFEGLARRWNAMMPILQSGVSLRFPVAIWKKISGTIDLINGYLDDLTSLIPGEFKPRLPKLPTTFGGQFAFAPVIPLAGAVAALLQALIIVALLLLALLLLYAIYKAIESLIEWIEKAVEEARKMPPIFWPTILPMANYLGVPKVSVGSIVARTTPVRGGAVQKQFRTMMEKLGVTNFAAHHVLPLMLGGSDTLDNMAAVPVPFHRLGHTSLNNQPQLLALGFPINLCTHSPGRTYIVAGLK